MVGSDEGWREIVTSRPGGEEGEDGSSGGAVHRLQGLLGGLGKLVDDFVTKKGGARSVLPPALCHPPMGNEEEEEGALEEDGEEGENGEESEPDDEEENECSNDEMSNENNGRDDDDEALGDGDDDELSEPPSSGIIIPMDDFEGPLGWTCSKPQNATLVKNPLASLMAMADIAGPSSGLLHQGSNGERSNGDKKQKESTKQYVLNVNFAGNEMMESHIRVILETAHPTLIEQMDNYLECEAQGRDPGLAAIDSDPPPCLFYYGYFSWNDMSGS
mmetsp:Transcript_4742/g.10472  ORF Transcript_4742/g.10472 Transcript_4742/m.10472 type:complete len:274 (+) Transcript_4742:1-822(+)